MPVPAKTGTFLVKCEQDFTIQRQFDLSDLFNCVKINYFKI